MKKQNTLLRMMSVIILLVITVFACSGLERAQYGAQQDEAQLGADIDGEAWGDKSGSSVSLSADGSIVAIGAI